MNSQQNADQQQVKQTPSLSVQEREISILNCDYNNNMFDYFIWYKKYPAKSLEFVISIRSIVDKKEDERFTVYLNKSAKHLSLHIAASQPGDSALYFCAANDDDDRLFFGAGTQLVVKPSKWPCSIYI